MSADANEARNPPSQEHLTLTGSQRRSSTRRYSLHSSDLRPSTCPGITQRRRTFDSSTDHSALLSNPRRFLPISAFQILSISASTRNPAFHPVREGLKSSINDGKASPDLRSLLPTANFPMDPNDFDDVPLDQLIREPHKRVIYPELSHSIVGAAIRVLNTLKPGLNEKAYENALVIELRKRGHLIEQQRRFDVFYEGIQVDTLVPDLLVDGLVVVDPKVVSEFNSTHIAQMMGYLAITGFKLAILLNFKHADLRYKRVVR
jgi:GxxExxY protein